MQLKEVGHHGFLRITYEVEDCEGGQGIICPRSVRVHFDLDGLKETVHLEEDVVTFNHGEVNGVNGVLKDFNTHSKRKAGLFMTSLVPDFAQYQECKIT